MAGRSVKGEGLEPGEETEGKLSILDLSDAKIVGGGDPYYQDYDYMEDRYNNYFTKDNEIGFKTFWFCDLTSVTLPRPALHQLARSPLRNTLEFGERDISVQSCHNWWKRL